MIFTSVIYLIFFIIIYLLYWTTNSLKFKKIVLLLGSLVFYATWSSKYLVHFVIILFINFFLYKILLKNKNKILLSSVVIFNLLNLFFFKYFYFFTDIFLYLSSSNKSSSELFSFQIIIPLAISFYTFQIISFQVDTYNSKTGNINLQDFLLFFLFFPQLIAGPILRSENFIPQLTKNTIYDSDKIFQGLVLIFFGICKKVLIADNISSIINPVWSNPDQYSSITVFMCINGFSWQVYCDFSGYSDIAIGSAKLLGYDLIKNFNAPFFSNSFRDLWKNWHISLSNWLRDYIYFPLGGNQFGIYKSYIYLMITFVLGGFWHGAKFTFIIWGLYCGIIVIVERILENRSIVLIQYSYLNKIITYLLFTIGVIFFRAEELNSVPSLIKKFFFLSKNGLNSNNENLIYLIFFAFLLQLIDLLDISKLYYNMKNYTILIISSLILFIILGNYAGGSKEFVYFQF